MSALAHRLATLLLCVLWLSAGFLIYGSTGHDDSHINFWNVHTLLTQGELVNYNGERVEQTTSLLQDFLTAVLAATVPIHLVTLGYLVDIAAALACCLLGARLAKQLAPSLANWFCALVLSSSSFLLWTYGGMGAPLTALCLLLAIACWQQWLTATSLSGSLILKLAGITLALTLVRPEVPVTSTATALLLAAWYWRTPALRRRSLWLFGITGAAACALFLWQHWYFGSWLPIPAVAKQGGAWLPQLQRGTYYVVFNSILNPVIALALLCGLAALWQCIQQRKNPALLIAPGNATLTIMLAVIAVYAGFIWSSGGDWMQAGRFWVPILCPAALLILQVLARWRYRLLAHAILCALVIAQLGMQYQTVAQLSHGIPVWVKTRITTTHQQRYSIFEQLNQEHVRDMAIIDHLHNIIPVLHQQLQRPVQLMSGQAGMVFYYTAQAFYGQVQFRDLRGLVESSLTLCPQLRDMPRSPQGLFWGYREFFSALPTLQTQCAITAPDIIYDLNDMSQKLGKTLETLGYTLIHRESGRLIENTTPLPSNRLLVPNLIFVRNDLLPLLGNPTMQVIDYRQLPLQVRWPLQNNPRINNAQP